VLSPLSSVEGRAEFGVSGFPCCVLGGAQSQGVPATTDRGQAGTAGPAARANYLDSRGAALPRSTRYGPSSRRGRIKNRGRLTVLPESDTVALMQAGRIAFEPDCRARRASREGDRQPRVFLDGRLESQWIRRFALEGNGHPLREFSMQG